MPLIRENFSSLQIGSQVSKTPFDPDHVDNMLLANDVANFFVKKIDNIQSQITSININASDIALVPPELMVDEGNTLCSFRCLTESDVRAIISKSAKKSCKLDPLPTSLLVNCLDELLPVITAMVNSSLKEGYFPRE